MNHHRDDLYPPSSISISNLSKNPSSSHLDGKSGGEHQQYGIDRRTGSKRERDATFCSDEASNEGVHLKRLKICYESFCESKKKKKEDFATETFYPKAKERNSDERKIASEIMVLRHLLPDMDNSPDRLPRPVALDPLLGPVENAVLSRILDAGDDEVGTVAGGFRFDCVGVKEDQSDANYHECSSIAGPRSQECPHEKNSTSADLSFHSNSLRLRPRNPYEQSRSANRQQQNIFLVHPLSVHPIDDANNESDGIDGETGANYA